MSHLLMLITGISVGQGFLQSKGQKNRELITFVFSCSADNDLYRAVVANGYSCSRYDNPAEAIAAAPTGSGLLILADAYPEKTNDIKPSVFEEAAKKNIRLYIEYPASLPGIELGRPVEANLERVVVSSRFFGSPLNPMRILSINALTFIPTSVEKPFLVAAKVAGFDSAVYGLPKERWPILFEHSSSADVLVSTTKLSHFISGRYGPHKDWQRLWQRVLQWVCPEHAIPPIESAPIVRTTYSAGEILPNDAEEKALYRGIEWYIRSKLLVPASRKIEAQRMPTPPPDAPIGDGSLGILEAQLSIIQKDGSQIQSTAKRGDCIGESAMALAFGQKIFRHQNEGSIARNLLDFYYFTSDAQKKERGDPKHGAYGLIAWGISSDAWYKANYGDDNARLLMGTMATSALLNDDRWNEAMMRCLLANLRTTGVKGFRGDRIDIPELSKNGWQYYFKRSIVSYSGNFEAYLWACYLWAYQQTGYKLFYDRAEKGLRMMMAEYADTWRWGSGLSQEKARILLPLAWLVRVKDTPEHRAWLNKAVDGLLALQEPCGAIREQLGTPGKGMFPPPDSNDEYGVTEAPLIQEDGDPVSDLLYTTNFAFLGLHEAASATGDARLRKAEDEMAKFLCRIQISSHTQPSLDGGWFRAFDFKRWEAWGSNADAGWGAWAIETGWSQSWITSVLAMRKMNTSFWDLTKNSSIEKNFERLRKEMIPDEVINSLEKESGLR